MTDDGERSPDSGFGDLSDGQPNLADPTLRDNVHHLPFPGSTGAQISSTDVASLPASDISKPGFAILARLCGALRGFDPESTGMRIPLADLEDDEIRKIDDLLGCDSVRIETRSDPIRKGYATRLSGVWRAQIETPQGESLFEWLEIGDVPSFVRDLAVMDGGAHAAPNGKAEAANGQSGSTETERFAEDVLAFANKITAAAKLFRHGQHNTSFALDGLGQPAGSSKAVQAADALRRKLGDGSVRLTSDARGAMQAHTTGHLHIWLIEKRGNGSDQDERGAFQIEIGDVPAAMRALPQDIEQSAIRFAGVLERIVLGAPLASVRL